MPFTFHYEDDMYPSTNFNLVNLDWILQLAEQLKETAESGGFDGAPGAPGTATNGIAFFNNSSIYSDFIAAVSGGQLPIYETTINGRDTFLVCTDHSTNWADFIAFFGSNSPHTLYVLRWNSNNLRQTYTYDYAPLGSPQFTGNPTAPTQAITDSSNKIATTSFVQNAVVAAVQSAIESLTIAPFSENFKQALLTLAEKVAYIDGNGTTYYQALYDALYPPINVDYITAAWTPPVGYVVYSTDTLDSLKNELTVTAYYDDQTSAVLSNDDYVLSGTLTPGTAVITVSYAGSTTTVNVPVVENSIDYITASFTQGTSVIYETDSLDILVPMLVVTATYTNLNTVYVDYPDYSLSGSLTSGTSVITVTYSGVTTTFNVTVTAWDYEWSYADGGLPATVAPNDWTWVNSTDSGHTVSFVANKGIHWVGYGGYIQLRPKNSETANSGVSEAIVNFESISSQTNFVVRLSNGTNGVQVSLQQIGIRMFTNNATPISGITLATNTDYTIRTEYGASSVKVYLNGILIYSGSPSTSVPAMRNEFMISNAISGSNSFTMNIKAARFKF